MGSDGSDLSSRDLLKEKEVFSCNLWQKEPGKVKEKHKATIIGERPAGELAHRW